jgi:signal peptidase II
MNRFSLYGFVLALLVIILDQATKIAALSAGLADHTITILPVFDLVLVWNHGVSFGMFNHGQYLPPMLFAAASGAIGLGFAFWLTRAHNLVLALGLGLVVGGAVGNIIDRFRLGAVVDFLDFHIGDLHWPAFNIADSGVVIGIALVLFDSLFFKRPDAKGDAKGESGVKTTS